MKILMSKLKSVLLIIVAISILEKIAIAADAATANPAAVTTGAASNAAANAPVANTAIESTAANIDTTAPLSKKNEKPLPAVCNINAWVGVAADYLHNQRTSGVGALIESGIATPLIYDVAAQLHILASTHFQSADGYVFWRDPAKGLLGPHVMYTKSSDFHDTLYGLHGEYYDDNFTVTAEGGGTSITNGHHSNNIYYEAIINWYAKPDWKLSIGGIVVGDGAVQIGTEYLIGSCSLPGLAIFADAGVGGHNLNYGFLGLRYYFTNGNNCKPLIRRHREDMIPSTLDPISRVKKSTVR